MVSWVEQLYVNMHSDKVERLHRKTWEKTGRKRRKQNKIIDWYAKDASQKIPYKMTINDSIMLSKKIILEV